MREVHSGIRLPENDSLWEGDRRDWWLKLETEILPALGFSAKSSHLIQVYDDRFKGMDNVDESILDVFIPIEKNDEQGRI